MKYVIVDIGAEDNTHRYIGHDDQQSSRIRWVSIYDARIFEGEIEAHTRISASAWYQPLERRAQFITISLADAFEIEISRLRIMQRKYAIQ